MENDMNFDKEVTQWRVGQANRRVEDVVAELYKKILILEDEISHLKPTKEELNRYPTLKTAFEEFLIIKRLTLGNEKT